MPAKTLEAIYTAVQQELENKSPEQFHYELQYLRAPVPFVENKELQDEPA